MQQGDVLLFQTDNGGDIIVESGIIEMSGGLETMAYLCLFGGNENDDGRADNPATWWGNLSEVDPTNHYRSETQNLLQSLPATSANLRRVENAVNRDLSIFTERKIASSVSTTVIIPALNTIQVTVNIDAQGEEFSFEFVENWKVNL